MGEAILTRPLNKIPLPVLQNQLHRSFGQLCFILTINGPEKTATQQKWLERDGSPYVKMYIVWPVFAEVVKTFLKKNWKASL